MLNAVVILLGGIIGFIGSRQLRRPQHAAQAAAVARNVGGTLGRRKGLSPPELQRACFSEMVRHVRVTRDGRTLAPTSYVLHLHPDDLAVVDESRRWFSDGLTDALRQAARDNGWVLQGPIVVDYLADPSRHHGVPAALATPPEEPAGAPPVTPPPSPIGRTTKAGTAPTGAARTLALVRSDTGDRVPLVYETVTIGRSRDRVVMIDDTRVSRAHARIEPRQGGWAIIDDGSANGTRVNGEVLPTGRPCPLRPGDVIGIGPVDLRVTTGAVPGVEADARALDDHDRTRISGEVLPPSRWTESGS